MSYVYDPHDTRETPQCTNKRCYGKAGSLATHGSHCQADLIGAECGDPLCDSCGETICADCDNRLCESCNRRESNEDDEPGKGPVLSFGLREDLCTACLNARPTAPASIAPNRF